MVLEVHATFPWLSGLWGEQNIKTQVCHWVQGSGIARRGWLAWSKIQSVKMGTNYMEEAFSSSISAPLNMR